MNPSKPRVIKDYDRLDPEIQEKIKLEYPSGFSENLIYFNNKDGKRVSALPFETDDKYYLVRMTIFEAEKIIEEDDDYDSTGSLKDSAKEEYESNMLTTNSLLPMPKRLKKLRMTILMMMIPKKMQTTTKISSF